MLYPSTSADNPPRRSRRELLVRAGSGLGTLALMQLLEGDGVLPSSAATVATGQLAPHHTPQAKSII